MEVLDVISILSTIVFAMGGVFVVSEDGLDVIALRELGEHVVGKPPEALGERLGQ